MQSETVDAVRTAKIRDDTPVQRRAVLALLGDEVVTLLQRYRSIHEVIGAATITGCLAVQQRQLAASAATGIDGAVDIDAVPRIEREGLASTPGDGVVDEYVAIARTPANGTCTRSASARVGGLDGDVVVNQRIAQRFPGDIAPAGSNVKVERVNQPLPLRALGTGGGDLGAVAHIHRVRAGFNEPAVATAGRTCVQRARHIGGAGRHAA